MARLGFLYRKRLSTTDLDHVRQAVLEGKVAAAPVLGEAVAALARNEQDTFVQGLKTQLKTS